MAPSKNSGGNRFQEDDDEGSGQPAPGWGPKALLFRLRTAIQQNRRRFSVAASILLGLGLLSFVLWTTVVIVEMRRPTIEMAIEALDLGAYQQARDYAKSILKYAKPSEQEKRGTALYVYGVATCEEVDRVWLEDKTPFFRDAAAALAESRELGFTPDRSADGYFYLGKSHFFSRNYPEAIESLEIAREKQSLRKKTIDWYLANAYFHSPKPDYAQGLEALDRFETLPPFLERENQAAMLLRTFLKLRLNELEAAKASFDKIPPLTEPNMILQRELAAGKICMLEANRFQTNADQLEKSQHLSVPKDELDKLETQLRETPLQESFAAEPPLSEASKDAVVAIWRQLAMQQLQHAIRHFAIVRDRDKELHELYRQAMFLQAMCLEHLGEYEEAQATYFSLTRIFPGTPEAIASQFRWGYIEYVIKNNPKAGLGALVRFYEMLDRQENYVNPGMTMTDFADAGLGEIQKLIDSRQYEKADELLEYFRRILPEAQQAKLFSRIYSEWGEQLETLAENKKYGEKQDMIRLAQEKFRLAGKWYEELARWNYTAADYLSNVWSAAEYYERGRDFPQALAMYRLYLQHESVLRQAQTHFRIGSILFELYEIDAAIKELEYCLDSYPDDPVRVPARLVLACALQEKKEWDKAVRLLKLNLDDLFGPDSDVYRDSLYELGRVYDRTQDNVRTIETFEDILTLYPGDPKTAEAHYLIAKTYLDEEKNLNQQIDDAQLPSQAELYRKTLSDTQRKVLGHLKQTRTILLRQEEQHGLDKAEERMLRNTYFMIGRVLTAMGPDYYDESLTENKIAVTRYQSHPDVLQAWLQLARVYQMQNQPDQAGRIIGQAQNLLQRFSTANAFRQETVYTEQQWRELLGLP